MPPALQRALFALIATATLIAAAPARAQYTATAGMNAPPAMRVQEDVRDDEGRVVGQRIVEKQAAKDHYGNAQGNQHDLAIDGAFDGQTIAVLHFYTLAFDFHLPKAALKEKGFSVYRWVNEAPSPKELAAALEKSNQLWIIADDQQHLTPAHVAVIKKFFDAG